MVVVPILLIDCSCVGCGKRKRERHAFAKKMSGSDETTLTLFNHKRVLDSWLHADVHRQEKHYSLASFNNQVSPTTTSSNQP